MATVILTHQGAAVVARLSEWHAANRFHHVPAKPGTDPEYRLIGLSDAEAADLAKKVNALALWHAAAPMQTEAANPVRRNATVHYINNVIPLRGNPEIRA